MATYTGLQLFRGHIVDNENYLHTSSMYHQYGILHGKESATSFVQLLGEKTTKNCLIDIT